MIKGKLKNLEAKEIGADSSFYMLPYIPEEGVHMPICGQQWWDEKGCTICFNEDPNGDDFDEVDNPEGTEDNEKYDQVDINNNGLISSSEAEPAKEDHNGDGIYTPHPNYDYENENLMFEDVTFSQRIDADYITIHIGLTIPYKNPKLPIPNSPISSGTGLVVLAFKITVRSGSIASNEVSASVPVSLLPARYFTAIIF